VSDKAASLVEHALSLIAGRAIERPERLRAELDAWRAVSPAHEAAYEQALGQWHAPQAASAQPRTYEVNLPAQSLGAALAALSRQTGIQIFAAGDLVAGKRACGPHSRTTAIRRSIIRTAAAPSSRLRSRCDRARIRHSRSWRSIRRTMASKCNSYRRKEPCCPTPTARFPPAASSASPGYGGHSRRASSLDYILDQRLGSATLLRHSLRYEQRKLDFKNIGGLGLQQDLHSLTRSVFNARDKIDSLVTDTNVQMKLGSAAAAHTVLVGLDYKRASSSDWQAFDFGTDLDVFDPVYGLPIPAAVPYQDQRQKARQLGVYAQLTQQNVVTTDPDDPLFGAIQTGEIRSRGVELEANVGLSRHLSLVAGYSYTDIRVTRATTQISASGRRGCPNISPRCGPTIRLKEGWGGAWGCATSEDRTATLRTVSPFLRTRLWMPRCAAT
jgi:hypothetical protein